jgi:hypothetical protein
MHPEKGIIASSDESMANVLWLNIYVNTPDEG